MPLAESAIPKTALVTPDGGHYEFLRPAFGLCNAPGTFQRLMTAIFNDYIFSFVLIFLNEVLVFSKTEEEHKEHLRIVFEALRKANLKLKPKNCKLYQNSVAYLGYKLTSKSTRLRGCRSCIIQPPCDEGTEISKGGLVLCPSTDNCQNEIGLVMTVGLNPILEEAFTLLIPENHELSSLSTTMDYQRRLIEQVKVELQLKPPLDIDTATIKNLVRDFYRNNQERQRQNTAGGTANNVLGFLGLFGYHFFHNPNNFTLQPHIMSEIYEKKTEDKNCTTQRKELHCRVREQNKLESSAF